MSTATVRTPRRALPPAIWRGWLPLAVLPAAAIGLVPASWPRWAAMWLLVIAVYAGWKWATWRRTAAPASPRWRHAAYLALWPGLDAAAFLDVAHPSARPTIGEWLFATAKLAMGAAILWGLVRLIPPAYELLVGWTGMIGIVFVLHFGAIHLASCLWRALGVQARPLMEWPIAATSVSDFWGRRWNTAFRDLAHRFLFRPLVRHHGPAWATAAAFGFSGLVHDLVISVPAQGGYGWPTLFFAVQGIAVFAERSRLGQRLGLGRGWRGWAFTMLVLLAPAYGLFHPPFIHNVVIPFLKAIGAAN